MHFSVQYNSFLFSKFKERGQSPYFSQEMIMTHCQAECKQVFQWQKGLVGQCLAGLVFTCNFHCLIRPYWPRQVQSLIKDIQIDLAYKNQNVRGRKALKKGQSLILFTVRNVSGQCYATLYTVLVTSVPLSCPSMPDSMKCKSVKVVRCVVVFCIKCSIFLRKRLYLGSSCSGSVIQFSWQFQYRHWIFYFSIL